LKPVALFVAVTVTPGSAPPLPSVTRPDNDPAFVWAKRRVGTRNRTATRRRERERTSYLLNMNSVLSLGQKYTAKMSFRLV
jgi:hypothetical protein